MVSNMAYLSIKVV